MGANSSTDDLHIKITCRGAESVPFSHIKEFQGNLKKRSRKDIELIITSILKYGFSFPFFVWEHEGQKYCLDGHGRIQALRELARRGAVLPEFPVVYVDAADQAEAKQKLLRMNSQYGTMTKSSVMEFLDGIELCRDEIELPSGVLKFEGQEAREDGEIPFTEVLGEENNYIVLKFNTDIDFLNAETLFGLSTVKAFSTKQDKDNSGSFSHKGIGRVIDGVRAIRMIQEGRA